MSSSKPSSSSRSGSSKPSSSSRSKEGESSSRSKSSSSAADASSSSRARGTSDRREAVPFPSTVAIVTNETALGTSDTVPYWPEPEFGEKTDIKNVNAKTCQGTWVAAGTMFPLGMAIPSNTVSAHQTKLKCVAGLANRCCTGIALWNVSASWVSRLLSKALFDT